MLQLQTEQLYASAGFELRKWASSDPLVLQNVNQEKLASSPYTTSGSFMFDTFTFYYTYYNI